MADNITITAGSGTTIATDDEAGVHYQKVKLISSADAVTAPLSRAEDAAHVSGDHGIVALGVRRDTAAASSGTDGDYEPFSTDSTGRLRVSTLPANSGVDIGDIDVLTCGTITPGTAATSLGKAEDAAHATGDVGILALGVRRDTAAASSGTDGDYEPFSTDSTGRLRVAALPANSGVDIGDVDVLSLPASTNTIEVVGDVAHDAVSAGNPVAVGGAARSAQPTAVAAGDRAELYTDRHGTLHTRSGHQLPAASVWTQVHVPAANVTATKSQGAGASGVRNVCTSITAVIVATATAPTAVQVNVSLIDGASGGTTYLWRAALSLPATAGETRGVALSNLWLPGTAATAMTLEFSGAGGANTVESVSMSGVTITE